MHLVIKIDDTLHTYVATIFALEVLVSFIYVAILNAGGDILKFAGKRNC